MWIAVVVLGAGALLAWKAPRAFRWLLGVAGGLVLLAVVIGLGVWAWEKREASRIVGLFRDAAPIPKQLSIWSEQQKDSESKWGLFNVSPDTAYKCYVRMVRRNPAGVTVEEQTASHYTIEPLDSVRVTYLAMAKGWRPEVAGCAPEIRGKATVDPVEALTKSEFFKQATPAYRAELLRDAGASEERILSLADPERETSPSTQSSRR